MVLLGFVLLISAKFLNVQVQVLFKSVIDSLNVDLASDSTAWIVAGSVILGYSFVRIGATLSGELPNAGNEGDCIFGASDLVLNRSYRSGHFAGLWYSGQHKFGRDFAAITAVALGAYTWFTARTTSWRYVPTFLIHFECTQTISIALASVVKQTRLTRRARQLQWTLINFEGVKLFNNEKYEIAQYDTHLRNYGKSFKITISLAFLNSGQNVIFASALTAAMFLAAQGVVQGTMIVGDLVMVNQLTLQLTLLLNFLGTIYRETRQNLLDMETLVTLVNNNTPLIRPLPNLSH
ncbi:Iron-sulfur clusters transporter ATM1, mitochondrial [Leucoagaricus sp. SymC.cos]|nr:Iron-sulfur clusters transporter ATM1, mitochondrial [Leucoagaricus sp. SymC.cos]